MPTVGTKKFDYTDEGMAAAEQYATETGVDIEYEEGYEETGGTAMYKKTRKPSKTAFYKMNGHTLPGIKQR